MQQLGSNRVRSRIGTTLRVAAVALLGIAALSLASPASAGPHAGVGDFHGGGEFHGGGGHPRFGGFHGERHGGLGRVGRFGAGLGWTYFPGAYGYDPYDDYYGSGQLYYCPDPAGYYPYVAQCNTSWQVVPAN